MDILEQRSAEITEVDGIYVRALDEKGQSHIFMAGSLNRVPKPEVGKKGMVTYVRTPSSGLWYWTDEE